MHKTVESINHSLLVWLNGVVNRFSKEQEVTAQSGNMQRVACIALLSLHEMLRALEQVDGMTPKALLSRSLVETLADVNAIFSSEDPEAEAKRYIDYYVDKTNDILRHIQSIREGKDIQSIVDQRIFAMKNKWNEHTIDARIQALDTTKNWINQYSLLSNFAHLNPAIFTIKNVMDGNSRLILDASMLIIMHIVSAEIFVAEEFDELAIIVSDYDKL